MSARVGRAQRLAVQVGLSIGLLALVLWQADPSRLADAVRALSPGWFLASLALNVATVPMMAERWRMLLVARGRTDVPLRWLTETTFVALLLGQVLPTAVGGDAVRAVDLARRTGEPAEAVSSVVVDRAVGMGALVVLAAAGGLAGGGGLDTGQMLLLQAGVLAAIGVSGWLVLSRRGGRVLRLLVPLARRLRVEAPARAVYRGLHAYRGHPGTLLAVFVLAAVVQALRVVVIWMLAEGMGTDVGLGTLLLVAPVIFLVTVVPVSLNGIGLREAAFVVMLGGAGVPREEAFVLGLAFFAVGVLTAAVGGLVLLRRSIAGGGERVVVR